MKIRVYYEDTDCGGIVYHTNYLKYCERARSEIIFNSSVAPFTANRHFVVTKIEANYIKAAVLGDVLEVRTKTQKIGHASLVLNQEIFKVSNIDNVHFDELIFKAKITVAFILQGNVGKLDDELVALFSSKM